MADNPNIGSNSKSSAVLSGMNQGGTIGANTGKQAKPGTRTAWLTQQVTNELGLKDSKGKPLPASITGAQFEAAIADTKNNKDSIEKYKSALATIPNVFAGTLSAPGKITNNEINDITNFASQYANSATPFSFADTIGGVKSGNLSNNLAFPTSYSRTSLDQPNVNASNKVVNDIFLTMLGRGATDSELQAYGNSYLNYAKTHPTSVDLGQNLYEKTAEMGRLKVGQSSTTTNTGLNEQAFVENQVRDSGNYNAYTAASQAFGLMQKLASSNRAGV
jgi:hypothetical protein